MTDTTSKVQTVLALIEAGQSESAACREAGIARSTFRTTALRVGAGADYARALEGLALCQIEAIEQTIQDMREGTIDAQKAKVELDARRWLASRLLPSRFGDRLAVDSAPPRSVPIIHSGMTLQEASEAYAASIYGEPTIDASALSDNALREILAARKGPLQ